MSVEANNAPDCGGCAADGGALLAASEHSESAIGRRAFLVQSGILAAIAALNACGSLGGGEITQPNVPANSSIKISDYPSLANVGGVALLNIGSAPVAIVRTSATSFLALSRVCPHQGGLITLYGSDFVCTRHGATFNLNGTWIGGQRTSSMYQYTTSYDAASGTLTIS
jgi:Rieske Fe-S protein